MVDHSKFEKLSVQLVAISASNPFSQKAFADSLHLSYPILSDCPDLKVIRQYDVMRRVDEAKRPIARGAYFLVDKQGIVQGKWINPPKEVFPSEPFLKVARELEEKS